MACGSMTPMPPASLHVGTFTRSLLLDLARSTGRLERAGLDVRETQVVSSPAQFAALDAGELDIVMTSPDNVMAYRFLTENPLGRNLPVEIVAAIDRGLGLSLCVAPSLADVADVRDGIVAVDVPGSGFAFVAFALLEASGLAPGDYTVESLGSTPRRATALIEERCRATVLNAGNELRAEGAGCRIVSRVADVGPYLGTVVAAVESPDPDVRDVRLRFVDVLLETSREILDGQWEDEAVEAAMRLLDLHEAEARAHRDCLLDPVRGLIPGGSVDEASIATLIDLRRRYRPTPELDQVAESWLSMVTGRARPGPATPD
jgi:ABC-type nitrate/sulfonate/bicarbonate transport system substrate-binding protein